MPQLCQSLRQPVRESLDSYSAGPEAFWRRLFRETWRATWLVVKFMAPAFLIAGPTTKLPAMAAVWGLASRRVFALCVSFSLVGAVVLGYLYHLVTGPF